MNWKVPPMPLAQKVVLFLLFLCVLAPLCQNPPHAIRQVQEHAVSTDTYTDTMYPNDLRPGENHGYRTTYRRKDW